MPLLPQVCTLHESNKRSQFQPLRHSGPRVGRSIDVRDEADRSGLQPLCWRDHLTQGDALGWYIAAPSALLGLEEWQGLKPGGFDWLSARLKSCPVTKLLWLGFDRAEGQACAQTAVRALERSVNFLLPSFDI